MKNILKVLIILIICLQTVNYADGTEKNIKSSPLFPVSGNIKLIYKTSFDEESVSKLYASNNTVLSSNESSKFKYYQTLLIKEDGVYVTETDQKLHLFLIVNKEAKHTYDRPLLRMPLPIFVGKEWNWDGIEYGDGDSVKINVHGRVICKENIIIPAGSFDTFKVETVIKNSLDSKNVITEWFSEGVGLVKANIAVSGGGILGFVRDLLGYREITFELKEIKRD